LQRTGEDDRAVKDFFKPEFRNRLDGIVKFKKLTQEHIRLIVSKFVQDMNDLLSDKDIKVELTVNAIDHIIDKGYDSKMGARPLGRKINDLVKVPLSKRILFENLNNCIVTVDFDNNELTFDVAQNYVLYPTSNALDENGFITLDKIKSNC
jgi:ATP-dependent Clp protease ATP-binding subunit ClpA